MHEYYLYNYYVLEYDTAYINYVPQRYNYLYEPIIIESFL